MRLVLDRDVHVGAGGRVLVGGEPLRVLRLSPGGPDALHALAEGRATPAQSRLGARLAEAGLAHPRPAPAPADVTVVIPVRDRPAELDRCLAAVTCGVPVHGAAAPGPPGPRPRAVAPPARGVAAPPPVLVVDDGSAGPGALARVCARHGARVIRLERSGGPGAARNAALPHVATELVAFVDSDCVPGPGWVEALAGHFADPRVAAVAPRVLPARGPLDMGARAAEVGPGRRVPYVPSAALLVRRAALGAFEPALRHGEDVDLVWRLRDAGWRVRYDPAVTVSHTEPRGAGARLARRFRYGTSAAPLARRHPGRLAPLVLPPWPTATLVLLAARRPRAALAVSTAHAAALIRRGVPARAAPGLVARAVRDTARGAYRGAGTVLPPFALLTGRPQQAAYGAGVWWGALRGRTAEPLLPLVRGPRGA